VPIAAEGRSVHLIVLALMAAIPLLVCAAEPANDLEFELGKDGPVALRCAGRRRASSPISACG